MMELICHVVLEQNGHSLQGVTDYSNGAAIVPQRMLGCMHKVDFYFMGQEKSDSKASANDS